MSSLQQVQNYLRQKKASGRLSNEEEMNAYKAYFGSEAGMSLQRAQHELDVKRTNIIKNQNAQRIQQSQDVLDREEEADKVKGRMALAKIAVPDLFMYEGGAKDGGGAQTSSTQAIGSQGVTEGTPALSEASLDVSPQENQVGVGGKAEAVTDMEWGMRSVTGQSLGEHVIETVGTGKQNLQAGVLGGVNAMGLGMAMRGINEVFEIGSGYIGKMLSKIPGIGKFFSGRKAPTQQQVTEEQNISSQFGDIENFDIDSYMNSIAEESAFEGVGGGFDESIDNQGTDPSESGEIGGYGVGQYV